MRRWFAILMLFILPIRGLVGDAMAYSMLPMQLQIPAPVVVQAAAESKMPCHGANDASQDGNTSDMQQCTSCQVCHSALTYPVQATTSLPQTAAAAPLQHASFWHSAELRLSVKPPVF